VPNAPAKVTRVQYDGQAIPIIDELHWKLTLPHGTDPTTLAPKFRILLPTTCGDEPIDVASVAPSGELTGKWPASTTLYVDREGVGSAATVSAGAFVIEGEKATVLTGATCQGGRDVRVEDTVVGQAGTSTIVDAKGGHCYEVITSGFPAARLEGKRVYERPLDLFIPAEIPVDKTALRRCEHGSASFASLMGASTPTTKTTTSAPAGAFTANPLSKSKPKPPPPKPPAKPPRKPRK
jgi:hypothetical protein